jgi:hypothetical protein
MILPSPSGAFVPNTYVWDVAQIQSIDVNSQEFKELLVRLYQNLGTMATVLNLKDTGYYPLGEFSNSQLFFPNPAYSSSTSVLPAYRGVTRIVVNFGSLPNTGTKSVAHGLTPTPSWTFTRIYATASDTTGMTYIPIPSAQANLTVDATNVNITTTANLTNYNVCYVVLEWIKT